MSDGLALDKRAVRRSFENAAADYDAHAVLQHEVCKRMLERLVYIKLEPRTILDGGAGTGNAMAGLLARYPGSRLIELDLARSMVQQAVRRVKWWRRLPLVRAPVHGVCADLEHLPLKDESVSLIWSNLALQWVADLPRTLVELYRVLEPGGLIMFSTFGPDTLKELRGSYDGTDGRTHVNRFFDMHDIGDMLVAARYADPVMDMEQLTLTYDDVRTLMRDLKAIGAHNSTHGRPAGLSTKSVLRAVESNYEAFRREGKLPATFEIVYGHAWKPLPRVSPTGRRVIDIKTSSQAVSRKP